MDGLMNPRLMMLSGLGQGLMGLGGGLISHGLGAPPSAIGQGLQSLSGAMDPMRMYQMHMMGQQMKRQKAWEGMLADTPSGGLMGGYSPDMLRALGPEAGSALLAKQMTPIEVSPGASLVDPGSRQTLYTAPSRPPTPTERDKLRADLEESGYSPNQIRDFMINRDRFQLQTDMFGNRTVFDRYMGQPVGGMGPQTAMTETFEQTAQAPEGVPTLTKGFESGTGASGFFGNIANTITDAVGAGLVAPQVEQAKTALDTLKTRTMLQMTAAMPGRPSDLIRERLEGLAVTPGSLFTGDERALTRLIQTRGLIGEEMDRLQTILDNPEGYKADDLAAARANMSQLAELQETYDHIIGNWRQGSAGEPGQPMQVNTKAEYDKLPSGTRFIAPDGTIRIKP